jgi:GPI mannosyltransferase 1 subunit M
MKHSQKGFFSGLFTWNRIKFAVISGGLFLALIGVFCRVYPDDFLYQTYLYHLIRKDNRHNFSAYFYFIYLHYTSMTKL